MESALIKFYEPSDDHHHIGEHCSSIDLSTVCNYKIEPDNPVLENYPYVFSIKAVLFPRGYDEAITNDYQISVETEEELGKWIDAINKVLEVIRGHK